MPNYFYFMKLSNYEFCILNAIFNITSRNIIYANIRAITKALMSFVIFRVQGKFTL
jgi:hypothetical protein